MSYRNPLEVFHFDKPFLEAKAIRAQATVVWAKVVKLPQGTSGWRIHNRGGFTILYGYQEAPTKWEELQAGVADSKGFVPREIWAANFEVIPGRNVDVYVEYWVPEKEEDRKKGEGGVLEQLRGAFQVFKNLWGGG